MTSIWHLLYGLGKFGPLHHNDVHHEGFNLLYIFC